LNRKTIVISLSLVTAILIALFFTPNQTAYQSATIFDSLQIDSASIVDSEIYLGIVIDSLEIKSGKIKRNQNLSDILEDYNVSSKTLYDLSKSAKDVHDVRKLKAGSAYEILHKNDSLNTATQFIYHPNIKDYVIYHLKDSVYAEITTAESQYVIKTLGSIINSSMYQSIIDNDASPMLVNKLVDVFAWQVDFFRINKGDELKVIYLEEEVEGQPVGVDRILGAYFKHWGKEYYAIPYEINEKTEYFDLEGNSLRKTFLRAPLNYSRISSRYSRRRFHPVQKRYKAHLGTDYAAPTGTPIRSVGDGTVIEARYHAGNGNYVKVRHNSNYTTQYLHMSKIKSGIKKGVEVKQGQTIGFVGSTGLATGPHLCYRFWKNGKQVDALKVDLPASEGIDENEKEAFLLKSDSLKTIIDSIRFSDEMLNSKLISVNSIENF